MTAETAYTTVAERVWGDGVAAAMTEWGLSRDVVLMACWWWTTNGDIAWGYSPDRVDGGRKGYGRGSREAGWQAWADGYLAAQYGNASAPGPKDEIPDPPEVQP